MDDTAKEFEVISINDSQENTQTIASIVPHERQVIDDVIAIWKEDPATESLGLSKLHAIVKSRNNWSLSEKRLRNLLKSYGLLANNSNQQQFTYANDIKSSNSVDVELPNSVKIVMTSKRGKGLYAKSNIPKGELIWEEPPLFFVPPLANINLIKKGNACAYCSKVLTQGSSTISFLKGLDCNVCSEAWCSQKCKKMDSQLHGMLKHSLYNPMFKNKLLKLIDANAFLELQDYCLREQWNALYAIAIIFANILTDKTGIKEKQFHAMARVSQEVRYKALNSSAGTFDNLQGGALFVQEQQETLWKEGFEKFLNVFPRAQEDREFTYEEFMCMMGTYNINNLDSSIYLVQSHLNHCCDPNTDVQSSTTSRIQGLKVFASRDIKAGEELTTTYVNPSHTVQQRQRELRVNWGFLCNCQKCKEDLKAQQRRKSSSGSQPKDSKNTIRQMLKNTEKELGDCEIELETNFEEVGFHGGRRKSVRFDEKVIARNDQA
ncbi:uncharacterized protein PRCAT00003994001 [Priceomyces carsonii]|uniref:uncharacterized protein n=1 Tax=Priceomyces carsonii TaxID=28549 RepID=UPI002EDB4699|nr:unnamed protein product [Priceomyces carsonii]